jgi:UDP-glucose 4-epimerase
MDVKILITGGAGYFGKNLIEFLVKKKIKNIHVFDKAKKPNLFFFKEVKYFKLDLLNKFRLKKEINKIKPQIIIHLAALISVTDSNKFKKKYFSNNFLVTKNLYNFSKSFLKYFIFSSSAAVYQSHDNKIAEDSKKVPANYYGSTKLLSESFLKKQFKKKKVKIGILRFFNISGSNLKLSITQSKHSNAIIPSICKCIILRKKLNIYGIDKKSKLTAIRDYIHILDIINIIYRVMNYLKMNKKNLILNCCSGVGVSIMELIKKFENITKKKIKYSIKKGRIGEQFFFVGNNNRLKKILNYNIKYNLNKIIKSTFDGYKNLFKKYK